MSEARVIAQRYEMQSLLGRGGMGDVYRALDRQTGQTVAVKLLKTELVESDQGIVERFDREGEMLRRLNHPNIVKVLATLQENGRHYIIMEYVGGGSLADLLREQPQLPADKVLNMALDLSDALTRAHRLRIIHRDIKPANVLLAEDGTPRLTDFGVAHMGDRTRVTESGALIGTYAYLSPEACSGLDLDERTDIWSFGVMLYEALAGKRPFSDAHPAATLTAILTQPIPDLAPLRSDVPAALISLVNQMLVKDRDQRIPSIRMVGAALEGIIHDPSAAARSWTPTPTATTSRPLVAFAQPPTPPPPPQTPAPQASITPVTTSPAPDMPRIFISYRRSDSAAITGRLYDRLTAAFGEENVFKDVNSIPIGAHFKDVLEREVRSCQVTLVIIGSTWVNAQDKAGQIRLQDAEDYVRIEVEAALTNPDHMVVPVLVNDATMPTIAELPATLHELIYRNAAPLRNDPDFNRDVAQLISQIRTQFGLPQTPAGVSSSDTGRTASSITQPTQVPAPQSAPKPPPALIAVAVAAIVLVSLFVHFFINVPASQRVQATPAAAIEPVDPGDYLVLVARLEPINTEPREVDRFIVEDLRQRLERDVDISRIHIREYPQVITSDEEARQVASQQNASVLIWGSYDEAQTELAFVSGTQMPADTGFDSVVFNSITNFRLTLTDPRAQSVTRNVLAILSLKNNFGGDVYEFLRLMVINNTINAPSGEVIGSGLPARMQQIFTDWLVDSQSALEAADQAVQLEPGNPVVYTLRAAIHLRLGSYDQGQRDAETAQRLGPDNWPAPMYMLATFAEARGDYEAVREYYTRITELMPDSWFAWNYLGYANYLLGDFAASREAYDRSLALNPTANFPYIAASMLAARQGRMQDSRIYIDIILTQFPDMLFADRIVSALFGDSQPVVTGELFAAFGNLLIGQYEVADEHIEAAIALRPQMSDLYVLEGLTHCNMDDLPAAIESYTRAIEIEPDVPFPYLLRGEARLRQMDLLGANADTQMAMQLATEQNLGEEIAAFVASGLRGEVDCKNFFELSTLPGAEATEEQG